MDHPLFGDGTGSVAKQTNPLISVEQPTWDIYLCILGNF